jgi:hypothetical protein
VRSERVTFLLCLLPLPTLLPLVAGLALLVVPRVAVAADSDAATANARLEVQAHPDCTSREEVAARVAARSRRIHFDDDATGPTLRAVIAADPRGGAVGELVIVQPDGRRSTRRLAAPSCAEATDAIALIIALTLDPTVAAATPTPASSKPAGPAHLPVAPDTEPSVVVASSLQPPVAKQRHFGGGALGQAIFGPAPGALPAVGVYLIAALDRDALWSPAVVLSATHAWSSGLVEPGGTATFTLDAASVDACVLRLHLAFWEARACATALYGRLAASGSETYSPASASRPFAAAGGAALMSVALGQLFELTGRVGAGASLIRDSFAFSPAVFHRTAAVTVTAGLGVGVRFP